MLKAFFKLERSREQKSSNLLLSFPSPEDYGDFITLITRGSFGV